MIDKVGRIARWSGTLWRRRLENIHYGIDNPLAISQRIKGPTVKCRYECVGSPDRRIAQRWFLIALFLDQVRLTLAPFPIWSQ